MEHKEGLNFMMTESLKALIASLLMTVLLMFSLITFIPSLGHSWKLFDRLGYFFNGKINGWEYGK